MKGYRLQLDLCRGSSKHSGHRLFLQCVASYFWVTFSTRLNFFFVGLLKASLVFLKDFRRRDSFCWDFWIAKWSFSQGIVSLEMMTTILGLNPKNIVNDYISALNLTIKCLLKTLRETSFSCIGGGNPKIERETVNTNSWKAVLWDRIVSKLV